MIRKYFTLITIVILTLTLVACNTAPSQATSTAAAVEATALPAASTDAPAAAATASDTATTEATEAPAAASVQVPAGSDLTAEEVADLLHMREEEKLARDVYLALYDKWQQPVFQNIAGSEQTHMDAIATLLATYGIDDPVAQTGDQRGVFTDANLQALYAQLVEQGSASLVNALTVGATIEDLDIKDLNEAIARSSHTDIISTYENLKMGSENHMRAFVRNLNAQGADYTPQFISMDEYQQILAGSMGRGQSQGQGQSTGGYGNGQGNGQGSGQGGRWNQPTPTP